MNRIGDNLICTGSNEAIVKAFRENAVEFVLVGGLAISWFCSSRQADDMDLLVNPTKENSLKVSGALSSIGLGGFEQNSFAKTGLRIPIKKYHYADILTPIQTGPTFEELMHNSIVGKLFNISVHIPSVANLIKLKERAVASTEKELDKHREDIVLLGNHAV